MRDVLSGLARVVQPGGPVAIVIGDNEVAGPASERVRVPTTDLIAALAEDAGFHLETNLSKRLTSYGALETVHQRNAMAEERVLIFRSAAA
jgi:hypothetical protein